MAGLGETDPKVVWSIGFLRNEESRKVGRPEQLGDFLNGEGKSEAGERCLQKWMHLPVGAVVQISVFLKGRPCGVNPYKKWI